MINDGKDIDFSVISTNLIRILIPNLCKNMSFCLKSFVFLSYFRNFVSAKREKEKRRNGVIAALLLEA